MIYIVIKRKKNYAEKITFYFTIFRPLFKDLARTFFINHFSLQRLVKIMTYRKSGNIIFLVPAEQFRKVEKISFFSPICCVQKGERPLARCTHQMRKKKFLTLPPFFPIDQKGVSEAFSLFVHKIWEKIMKFFPTLRNCSAGTKNLTLPDFRYVIIFISLWFPH